MITSSSDTIDKHAWQLGRVLSNSLTAVVPLKLMVQPHWLHVPDANHIGRTDSCWKVAFQQVSTKTGDVQHLSVHLGEVELELKLTLRQCYHRDCNMTLCQGSPWPAVRPPCYIHKLLANRPWT